jgi:predicted DNA-binding transcriptional regulator AlpA
LTTGNRTEPRTDHWPAPAERAILESTTEPVADRLLTAEQLADRWQLGGGKAAVYRMSRAGQIPTVKLGKFYRYRLSAIADFEANGGTGE